MILHHGLHPHIAKFLENNRKSETYGTFLEGCVLKRSLSDNFPVNNKTTKSVRLSRYNHTMGQSNLFDRMFERTLHTFNVFEEQCSPEFYFDMIKILDSLRPGHIIECGLHHGGMTVFLAQMAKTINSTLDVIDMSTNALNTTYNNILQSCPECLDCVRFFHGTMAAYIRNGCCVSNVPLFFQIDAAHDFTSVVEDLVATWFVRNNLLAITLQDTHLRSDNLYNSHFVDAAIYAVFGPGFRGYPFGRQIGEHDEIIGGDFELYFQSNAPEGLLIPMSENQYHFPRRNHIPRLNI